MFKNLGDLSVKRNFWEAIIFYLVYGSVGIFLCGLITSVLVEFFALPTVEDFRLMAMRIAPVLGGGYTFIIAMLIIFFKQMSKDIIAVLCVIMATFASAALGLVFGFIPVAMLSAFPAVKN